MPLYYFNVRNGADLSRDHEGSELSGAAAALIEVREMARDLVIDDLKQRVRVSDSVIEVTDQDGLAVGALRVRDVLDGDPRA